MNAIVPQIAVQPAPGNPTPTMASTAGKHSGFSDLLDQMSQSPNRVTDAGEGGSPQAQSGATSASTMPADAETKKYAGASAAKEEPQQEDDEQSGAVPELANCLATQVNLPLPLPIDQAPTPLVDKPGDFGEEGQSTSSTDAGKPVTPTMEVPLAAPISNKINVPVPAETSEGAIARETGEVAAEKSNPTPNTGEVEKNAEKHVDERDIQSSVPTTTEAAKPTKDSATDQPAGTVGNVENRSEASAEAVRAAVEFEVNKTGDKLDTKSSDQSVAVVIPQNAEHASQPDAKEDTLWAKAQSVQTSVPTVETAPSKPDKVDTSRVDALVSGPSAKPSATDVRPVEKEGQAGFQAAEKKPQGNKDKEPGDYPGQPSPASTPQTVDGPAQPQVTQSHSAVVTDASSATVVASNNHASHNSSTRTNENVGNMGGTAKAEHPLPPVSTGVVMHSAKLLERLGESEIRIGVQAGEFGNVDIRTSMAHHQMTAEISVEHGDLGRALAADLPNLQNKLAEHRITSANVVLQNQAGDSSSSGHQQGNWQRVPSLPAAMYSADSDSGMPAGVRGTAVVSESSSRLDIHM